MSDKKIIKTIHRYQIESGILAVLSIIIMPIFIIFLGLTCEYVRGIQFLILVAFCVVFFIFGIQRVDKINKKLKLFVGENVTKKIIAEKIDIKEYNPNGSMNDNFLDSTGILPRFDRSHGSDYMKGFYKGQDITYCDVTLDIRYETTDSEGRESNETVTVFCGPVISLGLGKPLGDKRVRIMERQTKRRKKGFLSDLFNTAVDVLGIKMKEQSISLESEAFNNQFDVKTNDDELGFYILTPHFMENIIKADELAEGLTNICFGGNQVIIAINNGSDAFEIEKLIRSKRRLEECRQKMRTDLDKICLIMDEILKKDRLFEK